jgi:predicted kinase
MSDHDQILDRQSKHIQARQERAEALVIGTPTTPKTLYLIRGLPGSGKSTLAYALAPNANVATDDFFTVDGVYAFEPSALDLAHGWCQAKAEKLLESHNHVAVHNTFTEVWHTIPYQKLAARLGIRICIISLFDAGLNDDALFERNSHGVPLHTIQRMRKFYVHHIPTQSI